MLFNFTTFAAQASDVCDKSGGFLGLKPWWYYLPDSSFDNATCEVVKFNVLQGKSDIPLVLLAVIDDLLRLAGLIAVGYVLAGGIKFITSQGDPEGIAKAQSTVQNALVGLAVTVVAVAFVSFVGTKLGS